MNRRTTEILCEILIEALAEAEAKLSQLKASTEEFGRGRRDHRINLKPFEIKHLEAKTAEFRSLLQEIAVAPA